MEILLAMVVATAVLFFGALISMGNERQRKAIDGLREQMVLWAVQDLKIKREHLAKNVQVLDPLGWLNKTVSKVSGYDMKLQVLEVFEEPQALICSSNDSNERIIFSPLSPTEIHRMKSGKHNRLSQIAKQHPLLLLPKNVSIHELSVLNAGHLFDLELSLAWKALTGQDHATIINLWMYVLE